MSISVCIITLNEEANLQRTLASVRWAEEIIVVDSGSADNTCAIAREFGAKVFVEPWQGFAAQKNSALAKATGEWILSLDADEEVTPELAASIRRACANSVSEEQAPGYEISRRNLFLHRWIKYGGYYPDRKLRLWRRGAGHFDERPVHETAHVEGATAALDGDLIHHAYPTLESYIRHMNHYSSLGAELAISKGQTSRNIFPFIANVLIRPQLTFLYNYFIRLGFLDGREGLLLHLYHHIYVSWKYAKAWERARALRVR